MSQTSSETDDNQSQSTTSLRQILALLEDEIDQVSQKRDRLIEATSDAENKLRDLENEMRQQLEQRRIDLLLAAEIERTRQTLETELADVQKVLTEHKSAADAAAVEVDELQTEAEQALAEKTAANAQLVALRLEISELEDAANKLRIDSEAADALANKVATLEEQQARATTALDDLEVELENGRTSLSDLRNEVATETASLAATKDEFAAMTTRLEGLRAEIASAEREALRTDELEKANAALELKATTLSDNIQNGERQLADLNSQIQSVERDLLDRNREVSDESQKLTALHAELSKTQALLDSRQSSLAEAEKVQVMVVEKRQELQEVIAQNEHSTQQLKAVNAELESARKALTETVMKTEDARAEVTNSEAALTAAKQELDTVKAEIAKADTIAQQSADARAALKAIETAVEEANGLKNAVEAQTVAYNNQEAEAQSKLNTTLADLAKAQTDLDSVTKLIDERSDEMLKSLDALFLEKEALENELAGKTEDNSQLTSEIKENSDLLVELESDLAAVRQEIEHSRVEQASGQATLTELESKIASMGDAREKLDSLLSETDEADAQLNALSKQRDDVAGEVEALREMASKVQEDHNTTLQENERLATKLSETQSQLISTEDELVELEHVKQAHLNEISGLETEIAAMRANREAVRSNIQSMTATLNGLIGSNALEIPEETRAKPVAATQTDLDVVVDVVSKTSVESVEMGSERLQKRQVSLSRQQIRVLLAQTPGLAGATADELTKLTTELENGTCTLPALQSAFGVVNRQTLVALIREIGPC